MGCINSLSPAPVDSTDALERLPEPATTESVGTESHLQETGLMLQKYVYSISVFFFFRLFFFFLVSISVVKIIK